ncbi:MAG: cupin domain-containing protein [Alphaproteobacteria bacterium]
MSTSKAAADSPHPPPRDWSAKLDGALAAIAARDGKPKPFEVVLTHGTARIGVYAPRGSDPQQPHDQDEVYVVARGSGVFLNGTERRAFAPGDMLFVPAGVTHRFESFTDDFAVWVVFYGPQGGEHP